MNPNKSLSRRGEIATILTLLSLGAILVGTIVGVQPSISDSVQSLFTRAAGPRNCPYKTTATVYVDSESSANVLTKSQMVDATWGVHNDKQGRLFPEGIFGDTAVFFRDNKSEPLDGLGTRYKPGDRATVTLIGPETSPYWKIKSQFCRSRGGAEVNGCPSDFATQAKKPTNTIKNFYVNCGVDLEYGWVLETSGTPVPGGGAPTTNPTASPTIPNTPTVPTTSPTSLPTISPTQDPSSCACNGTAPGPIRVCNQACEVNGKAGEPCNSDAICNRKTTQTPTSLTPPISPTEATPTPSQKRSHELDVTSDANNPEDACFKVVDTNGKTHEPANRAHCKTAACINPNGSVGKVIVDYTHHTGKDESLTITWKQNTCENRVIGELDGPGKNECRELLNTASRFTLPRRKTVRCIWEDPKARGVQDDIPDCRILGSKDSTDPKTLCPIIPTTTPISLTPPISPTASASPTITPTTTPTPPPTTSCTELKPGGAIKVVFIPNGNVTQTTVKADAQKAIDAFMGTNLGLARTKHFSFYVHNGENQQYLKNLKLTDFSELISYDNLDSEKLAVAAGSCNATIPVVLLYGDRFDTEYKAVSEFGLNKPIILTSYAIQLNPILLTSQIGHSFQLRDQFQYKKDLADEFKAQGIDSGYNCDTSDQCSKWASKPYKNSIQCTAICGLSEWFRPSTNSIMNHGYENNEFDAPSLEGLDLEMEKYLASVSEQQTSLKEEGNLAYGVVAVNLEENNGEYTVQSVASHVGYPATYASKQSKSDLTLSLQNGTTSLYTTHVEKRSTQLLTSATDPQSPDVIGLSTKNASLIAYLPYLNAADTILISDAKTGKKTKVSFDTYQVQKPTIRGNMCGNGICDSRYGENMKSCQSDCRSTDNLRRKGADVDNDGKVRAKDYAICVKRSGEKGVQIACDPDINGTTDSLDISILLQNLNSSVR